MHDYGLQALIEHYSADISALERCYPLSRSSLRVNRFANLYNEWLDRLDALTWDDLSPAGKLDASLLRHHILGRISNDRQESLTPEPFPFSEKIETLQTERLTFVRPEPEATAELLTSIIADVAKVDPTSVNARDASWLAELLHALQEWGKFHDGYDPLFTWWIKKPLSDAIGALQDLVDYPKNSEGAVPGIPVGRDRLLADLEHALIPYSPEDLIQLGEREYAWCLAEIKKAAAEMNFGDDWRGALDAVKDTAAPPGDQASIVRDLAFEAISYVEANDLMTVPALAKETWRMRMMTAEMQKVNPFFLGGDTIIVSYATDTMTHEEKRMSMRGNNPNFSRATVQHELIPGHHMQGFMTERHRRYRQIFSTPFWIEGWTMYWELLLWDLGFPRTPQERIGMLFWRMHRCVRIVFSLGFHLGTLTTQQCVEMLVDRVGHERANAEGEVRRSFNGMYPPLYQMAYLIGGLQFRALAREAVGSGKMTHRQFHDAIMHENEMQPAFLRLAVLRENPPRNEFPNWRFDAVP